MEEDHDKGRREQCRSQDDIICEGRDNFRSGKGHGLEHKMAGAPVICHGPIGRWGKIHGFDETHG